MDHLRQLPPTDPKKPVLVPGDPEELAMKEVAQKGGIFYTTDHIVTYSKSVSYTIWIVYVSKSDDNHEFLLLTGNLAEKLNVKPMQHTSE